MVKGEGVRLPHEILLHVRGNLLQLAFGVKEDTFRVKVYDPA
jgi:hypothetical protein